MCLSTQSAPGRGGANYDANLELVPEATGLRSGGANSLLLCTKV